MCHSVASYFSGTRLFDRLAACLKYNGKYEKYLKYFRVYNTPFQYSFSSCLSVDSQKLLRLNFFNFSSTISPSCSILRITIGK